MKNSRWALLQTGWCGVLALGVLLGSQAWAVPAKSKTKAKAGQNPKKVLFSMY